MELPNNQPIVLLRESGGDLYLPIWIGAAEATAIAYAQQGVVPPRPLTHDLFKDVLEALGHQLEEVRIVAVRDGVFYASLVFDGGVEVSSRSSDAIALALRTGTRIVGADEVLDDEGVPVRTSRRTRSRSSGSSWTRSRPTTSRPRAGRPDERAGTAEPSEHNPRPEGESSRRDTPVSVNLALSLTSSSGRPTVRGRTPCL